MRVIDNSNEYVYVAPDGSLELWMFQHVYHVLLAPEEWHEVDPTDHYGWSVEYMDMEDDVLYIGHHHAGAVPKSMGRQILGVL